MSKSKVPSSILAVALLLLLDCYFPERLRAADYDGGIGEGTSLKDDSTNDDKEELSYHAKRKKELLSLISKMKKELSSLPKLYEKHTARQRWLRVTFALKLKSAKDKPLYLQSSSELMGQGDFLYLFANPSLINDVDLEYLRTARGFLDLMEERYKEQMNLKK